MPKPTNPGHGHGHQADPPPTPEEPVPVIVTPPTDPTLVPFYGPRPLSAPGSYVEITPTTSAAIQATINANPAGTTYYFRAGTYTITSAVVPKTGDVLQGEYGAIFDASGWSTSTKEDAPIQANTGTHSNVTVRNLYITGAPWRGLYLYQSNADGWLIEYCDIGYGTYGVHLGHNTTIQYCRVHHNISDTPDNADASLRGGGYGAYQGTNVTIQYCEFDHNGSEQKITQSTSCAFIRNYFHDNYKDGIWFDGGNRDWVIEYNTCEDEGRNAITAEISGYGSIRFNTVRRAGFQGIYIATSRDLQVHGNKLYGCWRGIQLFLDCNALGITLNGVTQDLTNNDIYDNEIHAYSVPSGSYAALFTTTACSSPTVDPYVDNTKDNQYFRNAYFMPNLTANWFNWAGTNKTWTTWQTVPQDSGSSATVE